MSSVRTEPPRHSSASSHPHRQRALTDSRGSALSYTRLLKENRTFRFIWLSQAVSNAGDWFNTIAVLGLTLALTGSGLALSIVTICQMLPPFLTTPLAGVVAERYDRRRVMIVTDILRACVALGFLLVDSADEVWMLYLFMAILSGLGPFFDVTRTAVLPSIAQGKALLAANALTSTTWAAMLMVGSALGGVVADNLGRSAAFQVNAVSFVFAALFVARISIPAAAGAGLPARFFSDFIEGLKYIGRDRPTRVYLPGKATWGLAGGGAVLLYAVFGGQVYRAGDTGIAILYTARGLGTLLGAVLIKVFNTIRLGPLRTGILVGLVSYGVFFILFSQAPSIWLAGVSIILAAAGSMVMWVYSSLGLQLVVDEGYRGRVFAADQGLFTLAFSVSALGTGLLLDAMAPRLVALLAGAAGILIVGIWYLFARRIPLGARHAEHHAE